MCCLDVFWRALWCSVSLRDNEQLLTGLVYRSPSSSDDNNCRLISAIRGINDLNIFSQVLLFGDFNAPGINWEDLDYAGSETSLAACLLDAINDAYLFQHVTGFTCHRCGQRSSLLDLVFTLDTNSIQFVQHHSPLGSSDHECLTWQYKCLFDNNPTTEHQSKIYNYWKVGLSDTTVLAIYRDILKVSISRYFVINYRDTMPYIKNPFVMQYLAKNPCK